MTMIRITAIAKIIKPIEEELLMVVVIVVITGVVIVLASLVVEEDLEVGSVGVFNSLVSVT